MQIDPTRGFALPPSVAGARPQKPQAAPADSFQRSVPLADKLARVAAVSATASGVLQLLGAGATLTGMAGIGVLAAPVAVGLYLCKGGFFRGSLSDKLARVAAVSLTGTAAAAIAGAAVPVLTALALPAIVAAPVAVGVMLWNKLRGKKAQEPPPPPPVMFPPQFPPST